LHRIYRGHVRTPEAARSHRGAGYVSSRPSVGPACDSDNQLWRLFSIREKGDEEYTWWQHAGREGKAHPAWKTVNIKSAINGVVVFAINTDKFSTEFPKDKWLYLGRGIMVETGRVGLVHLEEADEDLEIIWN
jgi:hypothetical protein